MMNNSKQRMPWGRGGAPSSHASSDPILNKNNLFKQKVKITQKKSIFSCIMKKLFQLKDQKPIGELPEGLKGFFVPVAALSIRPATTVDILSDPEYTPPTERERNYPTTEPIFDKLFLRHPPDRRHTTTTIDPHQQTPSINGNSGVSHFMKKKSKGSFERSTQERSSQAGTVEGKSPLRPRRIRVNTNQIQDAKISYVKDVDFFRYANTRNIEDWVEQVRRESI